MATPNLFLVGAPKCGTTSLYDYLGHHPDVYCPKHKEPCYISRLASGFPFWGIGELSEYLSLYEDNLQRRYRVDGSTWNLTVEGSAEAIKDLSPNAKIVCMLRSPIIRAFSSWSFSYTNGWTRLSSFTKAIAEEINGGDTLAYDCRHLAVGRYYKKIDTYMRVFGSNQIKVIIFEDFAADPLRVLQELATWLDIREFEPVAREARNRTRLVPAKRILQGLPLKKAMITSWNRVPYELRQSLKRLPGLHGVDITRPSHQQLIDLWPYYQDDVRKLSALLKRDLSKEWAP